MPRNVLFRVRPLSVTLLAATAIFSLGGCLQVLLTSAYMLNGMQIKPEFKDLKGKTVVACRPLVELQYSSTGAAQQLARTVGALINKKASRVDVVAAQKVEQWTDEHEWEEFPQVGKAMKADYVVGIEIEEFSLYQGQTIYQGKARVHVTVHDMKNKGETVYEKTFPQFVYPPSAGLPTSEKSEDQFAREFTAYVAEQIGRCFYAFDPRDDAAMDSRAL